MSGLYTMFETDPVMEKEGILLNYGDVRFTVARMGGANTKYRRLLKSLMKPYRRQIDNDQLSDEVEQQIRAEAAAGALVLNAEVLKKDDKGMVVKDEAGKEVWVQGLPTKTGDVIEFSKANLLETFEVLPDLLNDIQFMAGTASNYAKEEREADEKN